MSIIRRRIFAVVMVLAMALTVAMPMQAVASNSDNVVRAEGTMLFGTVEEYSTSEAEALLRDSYYYDDSWFSADPAERNDSLALISMQLTGSALENDEASRCAGFLSNLGFGEVRTRDLAAGISGDDLDTGLGYTYGIKTIGDEVLAAVVVHSYAFDKASKRSGWTQNFTVNSASPAAGEEGVTGEHCGFRTAAAQFDVEALIQDMNTAADGSGNLKIWVMGQSRGGAIANLLAIRFNETAAAGNVYAYTFEAPTNVDGALAGQPSDYAYIHNYICHDDIVTHLAPWGMKRYGNEYDLLAMLEAKGVTNDEINIELEKLASVSRIGTKVPEGLTADAIMEKLLDKIPSRADYSAVKQASFNAMDGTPIAFEYTYQALFRNLMGAIFAEDGVNADEMADHLSDLLAALAPLLKGQLIEAGKIADPGAHDIDAYYWDTAEQLCGMLDSLDDEGGNAPLDSKDAYVLLKLAAPFLIDTEGKHDNS